MRSLRTEIRWAPQISTAAHPSTPDGTGLIKFGARYYNPTLTRFTQADPSAQEANRYTYAGDNLVSHTDPSGLSTATDIIFTRLAIISLASGIGAIAAIGAETSVGAALWGVTQFEAGVVGGAATGACDASDEC